MKNRLLLAIPMLCATATTTNSIAAKTKRSNDKVNLLFIITDQQRADAIGAAGCYPFLNTPNLDKLADSGAYFTNAYTPSPSSAPARSSMLTGETIENSRVLGNSFNKLTGDDYSFTTKPTFDQVLANAGYYSEYQGKWHSPIEWSTCYNGFEWLPAAPKLPHAYKLKQVVDYAAYMEKKYANSSYRKGDLYDASHGAFYTPDPIDGRVVSNSPDLTLSREELKNKRVSQSNNHGLLHIDDSDSRTAYQVNHGIEALDRVKGMSQPFNITVSISFPHPPMVVTPKYHLMYDLDKMIPAESINDRYIDSPYRGGSKRIATSGYSDPKRIPYMMSNYFGLVTEVDEWLGVLFDKLEEIGERDNTLIVFVSDHGEMLGAHGLSGKGNFYEESCRVPFIFNFPGVIEPRRIDYNVSTLDVYATILDYMGVKPVEGDSKSLRYLIEGGKKEKNIAVVEWNSKTTPSHMIIKDNWKLVTNYSPEYKVGSALYNTAEDSSEMVNYIGKSNPDRVKNLKIAEELRADLVEWLEEHNSSYVEALKQVKL